jgi:transposase
MYISTIFSQGGTGMMGKPQRREGKLFYTQVNLDERVPANHPLRRIASVVDFSFARRQVAALYGRKGHESLDPALTLKLLFLCFYENVRSERELMRELPLRLDWLWFCELDLDSPIPDHSVLSKARSRWGQKVFEELFSRVVNLCQQAGLVEGKTLHADSTLLKASASLEGRVSRKLWEQLEAAENPGSSPAPAGSPADTPADGGVAGGGGATSSSPRPAKLNERLVSPVDPDAATSTRKQGGTTLGYRDHRLVDDQHGVILATCATAADVDDGAMLQTLVETSRSHAGIDPEELVGDSMYGTQENYQWAREEGIKAYLKKRRGKDSPKVSWLKLLPEDCTRTRALYLLGRRRSRSEGGFAEAHVRMNHRRCRWRRRQRVQMQCYLVASVQNIKKLLRCSGRRSPAALALAAVTPRGPLPRRLVQHPATTSHRHPMKRSCFNRHWATVPSSVFSGVHSPGESLAGPSLTLRVL